MGSRARTGAPIWSASSCAWLGPNSSNASPQWGHVIIAMFSTMPRIGLCICFARPAAFSTIMLDSSCGVVTMRMPSTGRDWNAVRGTSAVPGGRSTMRTSKSPHAHVSPELLDGGRKQRAAPDDRLAGVVQEQVHGDDLDPGRRLGRDDANHRGLGTHGQAEQTRDGGPRDVRVQDAYLQAAACQRDCRHGGHEGLAHAALAAGDREHVPYVVDL